MFGEEMMGFWFFSGFGMFLFLVLVGAGINVYLRGKGTMYANLQRVEVQSLSENANDDDPTKPDKSLRRSLKEHT